MFGGVPPAATKPQVFSYYVGALALHKHSGGCTHVSIHECCCLHGVAYVPVVMCMSVDAY